MALITVSFLEDRVGTVDPVKAQARIDDVSAEVVDYVALFDNDPDDPIGQDAWDEATTPASVQAVVARVVERSLSNPMGVTQEGLGDHNWSFPMGASGATLGPKDRRQIRRAIRRLGVVEVTQEGYLPVEPEGFDPDMDLVL